MPGGDGSVHELEAYQSHVTLPDDFDSFWESKLEVLRDVPLSIERIRLDSYIRNVIVEQITYQSLEGILHHATYISPNDLDESLPVVVMYHGYDWNTHEPHIAMKYVVQGMGVLLVETRDQGMVADQMISYPMSGASGWMTKGIFNTLI